MSRAGLPLRAIASPIASAVARHRPAMSRSTQRGCGIDCGTRRRDTDNCEPSASKSTAFVTVSPLSIPSRLVIVSSRLQWDRLCDGCDRRRTARHTFPVAACRSAIDHHGSSPCCGITATQRPVSSITNGFRALCCAPWKTTSKVALHGCRWRGFPSDKTASHARACGH